MRMRIEDEPHLQGRDFFLVRGVDLVQTLLYVVLVCDFMLHHALRRQRHEGKTGVLNKGTSYQIIIGLISWVERFLRADIKVTL